MITIDRDAAKKRVAEAKDIPIFQLDDEDGKPVTYSVKDVKRSEVQLRFLDIANDRGEAAANYYLLSTMLGQDAYDALMGIDGLDENDLSQIVEKVSEIVFPAANPKGKRP